MIAIITSCDPQHFHLLDPFVRHYKACGVDRFFINLHFDTMYAEREHGAYLDQANGILSKHRQSIYSTYSCPFDAAAVRNHHESIQSRIAGDFSWIVWADIDEFHEFPVDLPAMVETFESAGYDYISGRFVDRMSRNGFPEFREGQSIWSQFPLGTDMTRTILRGVIDKVTLSRSSVLVIPGHHSIRHGQIARPFPGILPVHHFKWDASVVPRLRRRLEKDWKERCPWWVQSSRALNWLDRESPTTFDGLRVFDFGDDLPGYAGGGPLSNNRRYMRARRSEKIAQQMENPND